MSRVLRSFTDYLKRADKLFWLISIAIAIYGLILVKSVSRATNTNYFKTQLIAILIGYAVAIFLTLIDYRAVSSYWWLVAGFCVFLIVYTLIFGEAVTGTAGVNAKAWVKLPGLPQFQPSELVKIGFLITFSKHLTELKDRDLLKSPLHVMLLAAHALLPIGLVHLQGDDGAGVIFFFMFLCMAFAAGVQLRYFAGLFGAILIAVPLAWKYVLKDYQKTRFTIVYNLNSDPLGNGMQQLQGQLSIGSGQFWGRGLFNGPRVERGSVPLQWSDFIFSVAGEELGFIGCALIILLLLLYLIRVLYIARKSCDGMGSYICFGFFGMIASQAVFNLGMCLNILPVMGVTLPFFSSGENKKIKNN